MIDGRDLRSLGVLKLVAAAAILLSLPSLFGPVLAGEIIVFAIFAIGFNFLLGYAGELSFGHAALIGSGAYGTILFANYVFEGVFVSMFVAILAVTVIGVVYGYVSIQRRGIYFAMITLALAQIFYFLAFELRDYTGGDDGIALPFGIESPLPVDPTAGGMEFYAVAMFVLVVIWFGVKRIVNSPFGLVLLAIRENEKRASHLGYNANSYILGAFIISAFISGIAGALYAVLFNFIHPSILHWSVSGDVVLMTLIGGVGTLAGPIVGALAYLVIQDTVVSYFDHWEIVFGIIIIVTVLFAPEGIWGLYQKYVEGESQARNVKDIVRELLPGGD